jgi:methylenetetrahydrofolate reductase (NADPH)
MLKFATRAGASVPQWLHERFEGLDDDPDTQRMLGASIAIDQVATLRKHGISEFHFYTLNRAELTFAICYALGVRPNQDALGVRPLPAAGGTP